MDLFSILIYIDIILLVILNLMSFILFGMDKYKAKRKKWRIPEKTLLFYSILAPVGAFLGMIFFRHKTSKLKFYLWISFFLILHTLPFVFYILKSKTSILL
ncbi:MAG: DUF1294 domain-containing protein [Epulopiscium sp.]|nr:DUF1294 domain-containing protein [Candidatus Epulonipiscium sp.]